MRKGKPYKAPRTGGVHSNRIIGNKIGTQQHSFRQRDNLSGELYPLSILPFSIHCGSKDHPTQKPVALCEWLIKTFTNNKETVLDNYCGVGTTLVAAQKTNRRFIGVEQEKAFYDKALEKLNGN